MDSNREKKVLKKSRKTAILRNRFFLAHKINMYIWCIVYDVDARVRTAWLCNGGARKLVWAPALWGC